MVKSIFLQDGNEIFVDDEDYEKVNQHLWRTTKHQSVYLTNINNEVITLKKFLFKNKKCTQIVKGNDFSKDNIVEGSSQKHMRAWNESASSYKGVSWHKRSKYWVATIYVNGKNKWLGGYPTEEEAARAYNKAVDDYWGGEGFKNVIGKSSAAKVRKDNSKGNLSFRPRIPAGRSGFRGVRQTPDGRLQVRLYHLGKSVNVTHRRISKERAALIYNKTAIFLYENKAILNEVAMTDELKEFISNWEIPEKIKKLKETI